jgi:hypothetical protein
MRPYTFRILCAAIALTACGPDERTAPAPATPGQLQGAADDRAVIVGSTDGPEWPADLVTITRARIDVRDTLTVDVEYGGGCATHRLRLLIGRAFMESFPVQVRARLSHDAGGDRCKALIRRSLRIDLSALRDAYRTAYRTSNGSILIRLVGAPEPVLYVF